ncbi:type II secretion system protein [Bacillus luteolus]|uniref:Type II secretion system protein n=1 Tax=Litchfieldia luteola TaxID=682179 RepID=A0ABR9QI29_9BACI|nr:type II secretion system protein [Cytobacillus luteolus]MBE4908147.1 type II secretion system protein [Cytobacillus luteolus]MBP1942932.1 prepilin-type N-terminal cleavage/methylation domain-containing protein [Cytobacillus luteolus]
MLVNRNQKGITLIELLAVIVILGIISSVAIPTMTNLVQLSKDRAMVGNAHALKEAASLYVRDLHLQQQTPPSKITYKMLIDSQYIEYIKDPDTGSRYSDTNASFVEYKQNQLTGICLKGFERSICGGNGEALSLDSITVESIIIND